MSSLPQSALILLLALLATPFAAAYSLGAGPTDDTVCDLSPSTSDKLSRRTFVESGTQSEASIYERLAINVVSKNCKDGQILILQTQFSGAIDENYFKSVADRLCTAATVARLPVPTSGYPKASQLRCTIARIAEARAWLTAAENQKTTEQMIAEGAPHRTSNKGAENAQVKKDCGKLTLGTLMFGGGGDCQ